VLRIPYFVVPRHISNVLVQLWPSDNMKPAILQRYSSGPSFAVMVLDDSSDESAAGLVDRGIPFARGVRHSPGGGGLLTAIGEAYDGIANTAETLILMNHYPLENGDGRLHPPYPGRAQLGEGVDQLNKTCVPLCT
jgi:hypothetical protein